MGNLLLRTWKHNVQKYKLQENIYVRYFLCALLVVVLFFILLSGTSTVYYDLKVNDRSPEDIIANRTSVDVVATENAKKDAREAVDDIYRLDHTILEKVRIDIDQLFFDVKRLAGEDISQTVKINSLQERSEVNLPEEVYYKLLLTEIEILEQIRTHVRNITIHVMENGITQNELKNARALADDLIIGLDASKDERFIIREIVQNSITANMFFDERATIEKRLKQEELVSDLMIPKNTLIVRKGDIITDDIYSRLNSLNLLEERLKYVDWAGIFILSMLTLLGLIMYLKAYKPEILQDNYILALLILIWIMTLVVIKCIHFTVGVIDYSSVGYLVPVAMSTMLITILISSRVAVFSTVMFSIFVSFVFQPDQAALFDYRFGVVSLVSGFTGVFSVSKMTHRSAIMRAGVIIAVTNVIAISSLHLLTVDFVPPVLSLNLLFGVINGLLSSVLTIGILPFLESTFGILSSVRLLELSNPNHPLLRKLLVEAPGTYHHSVIVGNLAEAAAEAVDGDPLLARVGAYYHDIGKTKRPYMFIENQINKENPHDKIAPSLSTLIITSHPKDGLELAEAHNLPKKICEIIYQHHGTSMLNFFYNKAKESEKSEANAADFRYQCKKPQSKEAAIVMVADAVEAAVRAMSKPTPVRIESMIRKIMKEKLEDGQFDECDLTFKDLDKMVYSFLHVLNGIFHARIEYPTEDKELPTKLESQKESFVHGL
ncbi:hypothetical protein BHU72_11500 [Desulfuribacillus stibiiarsenatis]|uniref:HD domain-containing protein n=1 Tax=Desulfuribacillus stibiiarsenatis TaxID=1390249 RepID=A0A1E5L844_9FIRM|nr:HDIG domain-containing metalloprotein [Desulfuribacillus stibiiarsenatis]OEH86159.1 hypothetical protein BHU72_11500 [Desulfuribacillus stibiiarsenatis]